MNSQKPSRLLSILILIAILILISLLFIFRDEVRNLQEYGYIGIFLISIAANATIILPLPGVAMTTAMGAIFNPLGVAVASGLGAAVGELSGYAAGYSGQAVIEGRENYQRLVNWMKTHPKWIFLIIIIIALVPNPVMDLAGMAAGVLKIPVWKYYLACAIGKIGKMLVFAYAGHFSISWF